MKVRGRVVKTLEKNGKLFVGIQISGKSPKVGDQISLKWGATRSNSQNSLYWVFLDWLYEAGLKDEYSSTDDIHDSLKAAFLSKKNSLGFLKIGSTTDLTKDEFSQYMDKINLAMAENCGIDTSEFWREYETNHQVA